jgi:hypothetical protein
MFFFGPLHVLFIYGLKRVGAFLEGDHEVYEEIQRQAAKVPEAQRQDLIDSMRKNRPQLRIEAAIRLREEERILNARHRRFWFKFWVVVLAYWLISSHYNFSLTDCASQPGWFCPAECQEANAKYAR